MIQLLVLSAVTSSTINYVCCSWIFCCFCKKQEGTRASVLTFNNIQWVEYVSRTRIIVKKTLKRSLVLFYPFPFVAALAVQSVLGLWCLRFLSRFLCRIQQWWCYYFSLCFLLLQHQLFSHYLEHFANGSTDATSIYK